MVDRHRYSMWKRLGFRPTAKHRRAYDFPMPSLAVNTPIPPDILEIIQAVGHFGKVLGNEVVFFLQLLFVNRVEGKPVVGVIHQTSPPAFA